MIFEPATEESRGGLNFVLIYLCNVFVLQGSAPARHFHAL